MAAQQREAGADPGGAMGSGRIIAPLISLYKISKTLRLNHSKLKQYVCGHSPAIGVPGAPSFIELGLSGPMETYQCTVEMRDQDGAQMRIHVNGKGLDLMKLVRQFWMRQK